MFSIEVAKKIQTILASEILEDAIVVDDLFEGTVGPVEGTSDFRDPPLSFDVLSDFSNNVYDYSFMDLSIFEYFLVSCDITLSVPYSPTSQNI